MTVLAETEIYIPPESIEGVSYAEVREWIVWLRYFTIPELAQSMAISDWVAERFIRAAEWHGIAVRTGDDDGYAEIWEYRAKLGEDPRSHPWKPPPEVSTLGTYELAPRRGLPIRLVNERERREMMRGSGSARRHILLREKRYQAMQQAKMERAEKQRRKAAAKNHG